MHSQNTNRDGPKGGQKLLNCLLYHSTTLFVLCHLLIFKKMIHKINAMFSPENNLTELHSQFLLLTFCQWTSLWVNEKSYIPQVTFKNNSMILLQSFHLEHILSDVCNSFSNINFLTTVKESILAKQLQKVQHQVWISASSSSKPFFNRKSTINENGKWNISLLNWLTPIQNHASTMNCIFPPIFI